MAEHDDIKTLTTEQAAQELARLADVLAAANAEYHTDDAPKLSDAQYDTLKRRNMAIEAKFPDLKRADSPSDQVGAAPADGFSKIKHAVRMLSLGNTFNDEDVLDFDTSIRKFLRIESGTPIEYTAEPKIDGLSLRC